MLISSFPKFNKFTRFHKKTVKSFSSLFPPYSDFDFTSLIAWNINKNTQVTILNNNLVLLLEDYNSGEPFITFIGNYKIKETIQSIINYNAQNSFPLSIKLIPEHIIREKLPELEKDFLIHEDRDNFDYILNIEKLMTLPGTIFLNKRNKFNKFNKNYQPSIYIGSLNNKKLQNELLGLFNKWVLIKNEQNSSKESLAFRSFLKNLRYTDCQVLCVYLNKKLIGFSVFEIVNNEFAHQPFQKGDFNYKGIYEFLYVTLAGHLFQKKIKYLNIWQDMGEEKLRNAKLDYNPSFLKKYTISLRSLSS